MIKWENGTKIWCVESEYGSITLYGDETDARDNLRRKDILFSFVISEMSQE